jgi:hypothetical protein
LSLSQNPSFFICVHAKMIENIIKHLKSSIFVYHALITDILALIRSLKLGDSYRVTVKETFGA